MEARGAAQAPISISKFVVPAARRQSSEQVATAASLIRILIFNHQLISLIVQTTIKQ